MHLSVWLTLKYVRFGHTDNIQFNMLFVLCKSFFILSILHLLEKSSKPAKTICTGLSGHVA